MNTTVWQAPWPKGVIARYLTVVGATVDLTGGRERTFYLCTGCGFGTDSVGWTESAAHGYAQAHAETCRALPKPESTS